MGAVANSATVTSGHWDSSSTGTNQANSAGGTGATAKTTSELETPTDYGAAMADAFYNWNVNLDGVTGGDDPWDFGTTSDYPVLSYGGISLAAQDPHARGL